MNKYKVTKALLFGGVFTIVMTLLASYLISTTLSKLKTFNNTYQAYEKSYSSILRLDSKTEQILTTTDIEKELKFLNDSKKSFDNTIIELEKYDKEKLENSQVKYFWNIVKSELGIVEKKLDNKIFLKKNMFEKSLLRILGENFLSNKNNDSYLIMLDLKNSLDYIKQYEDFLIEELEYLKNKQQNEIASKIQDTRKLGFLLLFLIVLVFLSIMVFLAKKIILIEKDLFDKKVKLEDVNKILDKKVLEKTKQIKATTDILKEAQRIASVGSWSLDIKENKLEWSDEIFNIFQISKKDFEPSYEFFLNAIHPDDLDMVDNAFKNSLDSKEPYDVTHRLLLKNGEIKYVRERGNSSFDENGDAIYSRGTVQDITNEQNLKQMIIKEKEDAIKSNKFKSEFLANMSHEIRTPLNAILGFIGFLKDDCKESKSYNYVCTIEDSSKNLLSIIEDILDLSKIENNKLNMENIDFDTKKEFNTIIEIFKARAEEKNINLNLDMKNNIPPYLKSDPLRLKQIIANLLSNAIKFTKQNKNIYVNISYSNKSLTISVKDEGVGIAKDKVDKIFEAFTQEDTSTTREYGGTGLGLTISSSLVALLGGTLQLKSTKDIGSEFYFTIPIEIGDSVKPDIQYSQETIINKHILLVEDNITNQMFMKVLFKKLLISYDIANDGFEAIEIFKKSKFDAILMDENMPNMNGIEATKHIIQFEKDNNLIHTPIIALTANALKGEKAKFLDAGMDEYLSKPLDKNKFIETLKKVCD